MSQDEAPKTVADALSAVQRMQAQAAEQHKAQLAEFDQELERIRTSIANLQAQLTAVQESRDRADQAFEERAGGAHEEAYHLIFASLRRQAAQLAERNVAWTEAQRARDAKLARTLEEEGLKQALEDFQATERNPSVFDALPASYRDAAIAAHKANGEKLKSRLADLLQEPQVDAPAMAIDVVYAVDGDEEGGVAMLVTPVSEEVHSAWDGRDADLLTEVAGRVVQGLYSAAKGTPIEAGQAAYGGPQGLLAMEVELHPGMAATFQGKLADALKGVSGQATALAGAKVELTFTAVDVDRLLPPDGDEEADDA